jgi:hypothetical protein
VFSTDAEFPMTRRAKLWFAAAVIFNLINAAGVVYAIVFRELLHGATHAALLVPGVYLMWWLAARARRQSLAQAQRPDDRIEYLQQSIDALALEVERIGEAQRFSDKLRQQHAEISAPKQDQ